MRAHFVAALAVVIAPEAPRGRSWSETACNVTLHAGSNCRIEPGHFEEEKVRLNWFFCHVARASGATSQRASLGAMPGARPRDFVFTRLLVKAVGLRKTDSPRLSPVSGRSTNHYALGVPARQRSVMRSVR